MDPARLLGRTRPPPTEPSHAATCPKAVRWLVLTLAWLSACAGPAARERRVTVLLFIDPECPVSNFYAPEMTRLWETYAPRGVAFRGIHSEPVVTAEQAERHATEFRLGFPVLVDDRQALARRYEIGKVPTAVVLSAGDTLLYRGRIDDRYSPDGKRRDEPRTRDLEEAVKAALEGRPPPVAETTPYGCPLNALWKP